MLNIWGNRCGKDCDGTTRRSVLQVGALGLTGLMLPDLLRARSEAAVAGRVTRDTSVIWLWLGGGLSQIESFDPKMETPVEFRSTIGAVNTSLPGVQFGGLFPRIAQLADQMAIVRSFAHGSTSHAGGPHVVFTAREHRLADTTPQIEPSIGSIAARLRGVSHPETGMPTYVRLDRSYGDGPAWLGSAYAPFSVHGGTHDQLKLAVSNQQFTNRKQLLRELDRLDRKVDVSGQIVGMDAFQQQALSLILGRSKEAFDVSREDNAVRERYAKAGKVGEQLLMARRLCEAGCGFVSITSPYDWDMHGIPGRPTIGKHLEQHCPTFDHGVATFLEDVAERGLDKQILLVITGDFGRSPRINKGGGRDHWGDLCTLALAGGGLRMGQVVGESSARAEYPKSTPITPKDLMATIFHVLGVDGHVQFPDAAGRPRFLLPEGAKPIAELI